MADQFDEESTRYNALRYAAPANDVTSVYDSCDDQFMKDFIKKLTTEIRNILAPYMFMNHINDAIWISHIIEDIRKVLRRLGGVFYVIYRSGAIQELRTRRKIKPSDLFYIFF